MKSRNNLHSFLIILEKLFVVYCGKIQMGKVVSVPMCSLLSYLFSLR